MRGSLATALLALVVFLGGCSDDATSPEDGPPDEPPEASETIGAAGGTLTTAGFALDVPAGAFGAETDLKLYRDSESKPFGSGSASDLFRLEGLPADYATALTIRVQVGETTDGGVPMLAIGQETMVRSRGGLWLGWLPFETVADSAGWWMTELPAPELVAVKSGVALPVAVPPIQIGAVAGSETLLTPAAHFRIWYPAATVTAAQAEEVGEYLEEAFAIYQTMGFAYATRTAWPVHVTVKQLAGAYGSFSAMTLGENFGFVEIGSDFIDDMEEIHLTVGHEIFHFAQYHCDPRPAAEKAIDFGPQYWIDEATATWSEELYTDQSNFVSPARTGQEWAPMNGMVPGPLQDEGDHGYGMSSMFKYLVDRYGSEFIGDTYADILGGTNANVALRDNLPAPFAQWWGEFLEELVANRVYNDVTPELVRTHILDYGRFERPADVLWTAEDPMKDLSALVYQIDLVDNFTADENMRFVVEGEPFSVAVYRSRAGHPLELLGYAPDSLTVYDLAAQASGNAELIALVTNHHADAPDFDVWTDMKLTVRRLESSLLSNYDHVIVSLVYDAYWENGMSQLRENMNIAADSSAFIDNVFSAEWDSLDSFGTRHHGTFTLTIDPVEMRIEDWAAESRHDYAAGGRWIYMLSRLSGAGDGVPFLYGGGNVQLTFGLDGSETCARIVDIDQHYVSTGEQELYLDHFACTESSSLRIYIIDVD